MNLSRVMPTEVPAGLRTKNLGRGQNGHVRAVGAHDITDGLSWDGRWRKRQDGSRVLVVFAEDRDRNRYAALTLAAPGNNFVTIGVTSAGNPRWDDAVAAAIDREAGLSADQLRALIRALSAPPRRAHAEPAAASA